MLCVSIYQLTVLPQTALLSNVLCIDSYGYLSQSGTVSALFEVGLIKSLKGGGGVYRGRIFMEK